MELAQFRKQFPVLRQAVWLATPSRAPAARPVVHSLNNAVQRWSDGEDGWQLGKTAARACRAQAAALFRTTPSQIALMPSVAVAAATVAAAQPAGSRIVVGSREFRSNLLPWLAARARGVRVDLIPMPRGFLDSAALSAAITDDTSLVAVSDVHSATGSRIDLAAVSARCRQVGAQLFVDATQSLGVLSIAPVVQPDYIAVHGYKWLLSPRGAAWLYVRPDRTGALSPLAAHLGNATDPHQFYGGPLSFPDEARKLDLPLSWPVWIAAAAALDLLAGVDSQQLQQHCLSLAQMLREQARERGLSVVPTELPSNTVALSTADAGDIQRRLAARGIHATARAGFLRFGFHGFNTPDDIAAVMSALDAISGLS